jgi:hypothetical protein
VPTSTVLSSWLHSRCSVEFQWKRAPTERLFNLVDFSSLGSYGRSVPPQPCQMPCNSTSPNLRFSAERSNECRGFTPTCVCGTGYTYLTIPNCQITRPDYFTDQDLLVDVQSLLRTYAGTNIRYGIPPQVVIAQPRSRRNPVNARQRSRPCKHGYSVCTEGEQSRTGPLSPIVGSKESRAGIPCLSS